MAENVTMFVAAAFCPEPPLLHPDAPGAAGGDTGTTLRSACLKALDRIEVAGLDAIVVLGTGPREDMYGPGDAGDLKGYGVPVQVGFDGPPTTGAPRLPLAHTLGAWLLDEAGFGGQRLGLPAGTSSPQVHAASVDSRRRAMLVMGDASARRTEKSPGWYDPDAVAFDDAVTAALTSGDGKALLDLDVTLGARVLASGVPAWITAGEILSGVPMEGQVHYAEAPFGVFYIVASWVEAS